MKFSRSSKHIFKLTWFFFIINCERADCPAVCPIYVRTFLGSDVLYYFSEFLERVLIFFCPLTPPPPSPPILFFQGKAKDAGKQSFFLSVFLSRAVLKYILHVLFRIFSKAPFLGDFHFDESKSIRGWKIVNSFDGKDGQLDRKKSFLKMCIFAVSLCMNLFNLYFLWANY